jgi:citrate lyase subunit beta / citryl-CoA lyase
VESSYPRTLLFVPGHRESMVSKAFQRGADAIVFDLEDSVPPNEKTNARRLVSETIHRWPSGAGSRVYVRINSPRFGMLEEDIEVLDVAPVAGVVVPKVDFPVELQAIFERLGNRDRDVIVNIETPRSIMHAEEFARAQGVGGLFLGGEDLTESLGMRRSAEGDELATPRFLLLVACRAAGIAAYDTICPEFRDHETVYRDALHASSMGFDGKFAIHPSQIEPIQRAFTPSDVEVVEARRIVDAFDQAVAEGMAAVAVDGKMIDPPVAERARALLSRAGDA